MQLPPDNFEEHGTHDSREDTEDDVDAIMMSGVDGCEPDTYTDKAKETRGVPTTMAHDRIDRRD